MNQKSDLSSSASAIFELGSLFRDALAETSKSKMLTTRPGPTERTDVTLLRARVARSRVSRSEGLAGLLDRRWATGVLRNRRADAFLSSLGIAEAGGVGKGCVRAIGTNVGAVTHDGTDADRGAAKSRRQRNKRPV